MRFPTSYTHNEKIKALSKRIGTFCNADDAYSSYIDTNIRSEQLKHNLSYVLAQIILQLRFAEWSPTHLEEAITAYNAANETTLTLDGFTKSGWVRLIAGQALIAQVISHKVWQITHDEEQGKTPEIREDQKHRLRCLQNYANRYKHHERPWITATDLENVLRENAPALSIDYLTTSGVLQADPSTGNYEWLAAEHERHLRDEIAATLWLLCAGEEASLEEFHRYTLLLYQVEIWPNHLYRHISPKSIQRIIDLAKESLLIENDLLASAEEFDKIWLDAPRYHHNRSEDNIPVVFFAYQDTYSYIADIEYQERFLQDAFDHEETRGYYRFLVMLIIRNGWKHNDPYREVLDLLSDTTRPFLLRTLYEELKRRYPGIIPYLLTDSDLAPLAFRLISDVTVNDQYLSSPKPANSRQVEAEVFKTKVWMEMLELTLENISSLAFQAEEGKGIVAGRILLMASEDTFSYNSNHPEGFQIHNEKRKRYDETLKLLSSYKQSETRYYPAPIVMPRIIFSFLDELIRFVISNWKNKRKPRTEFIRLGSGVFDLALELHRISCTKIVTGELTTAQFESLATDRNMLLGMLVEMFITYYITEEIEINNYYTPNEKRKVRRGVNEFGFEIIDWSYLLLNFEKNSKLQTAIDQVNDSLHFDASGDHYTESNRVQLEKLQMFLRSLMMAKIAIHQKRSTYEVLDLPVSNTLKILNQGIADLSTRFSINDLPKERIDVFDEKFHLGNNPYYQSLLNLLFKCVNEWEENEQLVFLKDFFDQTEDLLRILSAVNLLENKNVKNTVAACIANIPVEKYIQNTRTTTELRGTMIEAVNSEKFWAMADPILTVIQDHLIRVKQLNNHDALLLFEVKLLIAYKKRDMGQLLSVSIPKLDMMNVDQVRPFERLKQYFSGLFAVNYDRNYEVGIATFSSLLSANPGNTWYAYQLYRSSTLYARANNNTQQMAEARSNWEEYISKLDNDNISEMPDLSESVNSVAIHYYVTVNDAVSFDQAVNVLSPRFLYDTDIIPTIYEFYIQREMDEAAYRYLIQAQAYLNKTADSIPEEVIKLLNGAENDKLLQRYRDTMHIIRGLAPDNLPRVIPQIVNDKNELSLFILGELIQTARIMQDKRVAMQQVTHENRFTDFLQSILRSRFPIFGWFVPDQSRLGISTAGKDAGSSDLVVEAGGKFIALIEAFILRDKHYTIAHILKCPNYVGSTKRFYSVVYDLGDPADLDTHWETYKTDVLSISFPTNFAIDATTGFIDLAREFEDVNHFKIAKTLHAGDQVLFHLMINLRT